MFNKLQTTPVQLTVQTIVARPEPGDGKPLEIPWSNGQSSNRNRSAASIVDNLSLCGCYCTLAMPGHAIEQRDENRFVTLNEQIEISFSLYVRFIRIQTIRPVNFDSNGRKFVRFNDETGRMKGPVKLHRSKTEPFVELETPTTISCFSRGQAPTDELFRIQMNRRRSSDVVLQLEPFQPNVNYLTNKSITNK